MELELRQLRQAKPEYKVHDTYQVRTTVSRAIRFKLGEVAARMAAERGERVSVGEAVAEVLAKWYEGK